MRDSRKPTAHWQGQLEIKGATSRYDFTLTLCYTDRELQSEMAEQLPASYCQKKKKKKRTDGSSSCLFERWSYTPSTASSVAFLTRPALCHCLQGSRTRTRTLEGTNRLNTLHPKSDLSREKRRPEIPLQPWFFVRQTEIILQTALLFSFFFLSFFGYIEDETTTT